MHWMYLANTAGKPSVEINQEVQDGSKTATSARLAWSVSPGQTATPQQALNHTADGRGLLLGVLSPGGQFQHGGELCHSHLNGNGY